MTDSSCMDSWRFLLVVAGMVLLAACGAETAGVSAESDVSPVEEPETQTTLVEEPVEEEPAASDSEEADEPIEQDEEDRFVPPAGTLPVPELTSEQIDNEVLFRGLTLLSATEPFEGPGAEDLLGYLSWIGVQRYVLSDENGEPLEVADGEFPFLSVQVNAHHGVERPVVYDARFTYFQPSSTFGHQTPGCAQDNLRLGLDFDEQSSQYRLDEMLPETFRGVFLPGGDFACFEGTPPEIPAALAGEFTIEPAAGNDIAIVGANGDRAYFTWSDLSETN